MVVFPVPATPMTTTTWGVRVFCMNAMKRIRSDKFKPSASISLTFGSVTRPVR